MAEGGLSGGMPGNAQPIPGFPDNALPIEFSGFDGLNTKPLRPGIKDQEMSWCDGWMPIGSNNLRTLYGIGQALYTASVGNQIIYFTFGNISEKAPILILFLLLGASWISFYPKEPLAVRVAIPRRS